VFGQEWVALEQVQTTATPRTRRSQLQRLPILFSCLKTRRIRLRPQSYQGIKAGRDKKVNSRLAVRGSNLEFLMGSSLISVAIGYDRTNRATYYTLLNSEQ